MKRPGLAKMLALFASSAVLLTACGGKKPETGQAGTEAAETQIVYDMPPESILAVGVVPVTWEPSPDHLIIEGDEAVALYNRIKAGDYPGIEEIKGNPVLNQIDSLSSYYIALYGRTAEIDTPEREKLREEVLKEYLATGSARVDGIDPNTKRDRYVYDGPLRKNYEMELVLGLPASGKSTKVTDPESALKGAFILDCDMIKELLPEYQESHGCAADAVHAESMEIMDKAVKAFTKGKMKGTNVILPLVADDFDALMENYIKPFEAAGYNVRARFLPCEINVSVARALARELESGRIINSSVLFSFGKKPEVVYDKLAPMINSKGMPYGYEEEEKEEAVDDAA